MPRRHGCLRTSITVDVQGCTNALKDRMSEKGRPEHKKTARRLLYLYSSRKLSTHKYYLNSGYASIPQSDLSIPSYSSSSVTRIPITFLSTNHTTKLAVNTQTNIVAAPIN